MRLIDADALMEKMKHRWERFGRESDCICLIEDAQTIDAVPVVRCGECKHFIEPSWECRKLIDRDAYGEADARV